MTRFLRTASIAVITGACYSVVFLRYGWLVVVGVAAFVLISFAFGYQAARWDAEDEERAARQTP